MQNPKWLNGRKVAIVTDWLTTYGGAEKVVATVSEIFPEAPIFTSQYSEKEVDWFSKNDVRVGWLNIFPANITSWANSIFSKFRQKAKRF